MTEAAQSVRGTVLRSVNGGYGLMKVDGRTLFVRGALPGEEVVANIRSRRKGVLFGDVSEVILKAPGRRVAPCKVAFRCGGCHFQHATPEAQREAKTEALRELLDRAHIDLPITAWHAGPETRWRCRIELHGLREGQASRLGFFEERSHRLVPADSCLQVSEALRELVAALSALFETEGLAPGSCEVIESFDGSSRVLLTPDEVAAKRASEVRESLRLSGVVWRHERFEATVLSGESSVENTIGDITLRHHALSFFQANRHLTPILVERVLAEVHEGGPGSVADLFSGVGLFSIPLARAGREVIAVEWSPSAFLDLQFNATRARVALEAHNLAVGTALAGGLPLEDAIAIVDPPRRGLDPMELDAIAGGRPRRVVYVSCDPATLARDLSRFSERGYKARGIEVFDMFPATFHLETLAVLERQ